MRSTTRWCLNEGWMSSCTYERDETKGLETRLETIVSGFAKGGGEETPGLQTHGTHQGSHDEEGSSNTGEKGSRV